MVQGIIFDFDGILVDSESINIGAAVKTFQDVVYPLTQEEIQYIPGKSSVDFIPNFCQARGIHHSLEHKRIYEINKKNYRMFWYDNISMFPETKKTIETLHARGKVLAIATTNSKENIEFFFRKFGMRDLFSVIITGEDVVKRKPDPEIYLLAIEKLHLPKAEVIAIEDTGVGLRSARDAGLRCVVIPNVYTQDDIFTGADFRIGSMSDLLNLFKS